MRDAEARSSAFHAGIWRKIRALYFALAGSGSLSDEVELAKLVGPSRASYAGLSNPRAHRRLSRHWSCGTLRNLCNPGMPANA